jgi:CO/xanthine dehydrogenase Mo-binding subunit
VTNLAEKPFSGMIDAYERVTGRIPYTINVELPGMAIAKTLRSTVPHARITRLDVSRARQVPGVYAVLTGADLLERSDIYPYFGPVFRDRPILAIGKVRYVGEPVVGVAAVDADSAQEALDLVDVEYDEMPAVFGIDDALAPGAPLVHEEPPKAGHTFADIILHGHPGTNICNQFKLRKGDIERGLTEADEVFEDTFYSPPLQQVPLETHCCVAQVTDGRVTVWATSQIPHMLRGNLAEVFKLPTSRVRVIVSTLGGAYGAKCYPAIEPIAAVLALIAKRPVKLHLTRDEEFVTVTKHGGRITLTTGVTKDGRIVARKSLCHFNTGAYADIGPRLIKNGGYGTAGPHNIPNVWVDSFAIYTNIPPAGAFRGYGINQAAWAYESQMDVIAERLGLDPYEFRMKNLLTDGQTFATGEPVEDCHFRELLTMVAKGIGWNATNNRSQKGPIVRGKGLSCTIKSTVTPSTSIAVVNLNDTGSLNVLTSSVEMGQGQKTAHAILAAERLGIPLEKVVVVSPDTDVTPYDQQSSSSRTTYAGGAAVQLAVDDVRAQLVRIGAGLLGVAEDAVEIVEGWVRTKAAPHRGLEFGEVVRKSRSGNLVGRGTFQTKGQLDPETGQGVASAHWNQAAAAAEVEVDLETGKVRLLRYHGASYPGRVVNRVQAELQLEGNVGFGVSQALFEEMVFDNGQLQNATLADYMLTSTLDMPPELVVHILENPERDDIHGIGETSLPPVMAAIGNAVFHATGVRVKDLPITPEKVLRGLGEREAPQRPEPKRSAAEPVR